MIDFEWSELRSVVFAGGGGRSVWQVGFWVEAAPRLNLSPRVVAGVSAGATMACLVFSDRVEFSMAWMKRAVGANRRNIYLKNLFNSKPVFPHHGIYRQALLAALDPEALARLHQGPDLRVLLARPPVWAGPRSAVLLGLCCYALEKRLGDPVHPGLPRRAGFSPETISIRTCHTPEAAADLLLQSSCTPPALPVMHRDGRPVLDGGLVDNAPVSALDPDPGPTLVLLTRRRPPEKLPQSGRLVYVQPSRPISIYKWDYTSPEGLQEAFDLGRRDGEIFASVFG